MESWWKSMLSKLCVLLHTALFYSGIYRHACANEAEVDIPKWFMAPTSLLTKFDSASNRSTPAGNEVFPECCTRQKREGRGRFRIPYPRTLPAGLTPVFPTDREVSAGSVSACCLGSGEASVHTSKACPRSPGRHPQNVTTLLTDAAEALEYGMVWVKRRQPESGDKTRAVSVWVTAWSHAQASLAGAWAWGAAATPRGWLRAFGSCLLRRRRMEALRAGLVRPCCQESRASSGIERGEKRMSGCSSRFDFLSSPATQCVHAFPSPPAPSPTPSPENRSQPEQARGDRAAPSGAGSRDGRACRGGGVGELGVGVRVRVRGRGSVGVSPGGSAGAALERVRLSSRAFAAGWIMISGSGSPQVVGNGW